MEILKDDIPVYQRARRLLPKEKTMAEQQIKEWLKDGVIRPSFSDYAAPIVPVPKKDGSTRICVDYHPLNKKIIKDRYPLPNIDEQIDALQGARIFTTLDSANGYFHIPVEKDSIKYTSFITLGGQYEFLRMPFGLSLGPSVLQRFINTIFVKLIEDGTILIHGRYVIIPTMNEEEALENFKKVLSVARKYGLQIKWKKCKLLQNSIEFMGYEVKNGAIRSSPTKIRDVKNYEERPKTAKEIQQGILGLTGYFRNFISNYASIARPLSDLLKKDVKFKFEEEQLYTFNKPKELITQRPVLTIFRYGLETEVHRDASKYALAAILMQRSNEFHPVRYLSMKKSEEEQQ